MNSLISFAVEPLIAELGAYIRHKLTADRLPRDFEGLQWTIHTRTRYGDRAKVCKMFSRYPNLAFHLNEKRETPLHVAAESGRVDVVKKLIALNEMSSGRSLTTPRSDDIEAGASDPLVSEIIREADLLAMVDHEGNTALHVAVKNGRAKVVTLLAEANPQLLLSLNNANQTPLSIAIDTKFPEIVLTIIRNNPNTLRDRDIDMMTVRYVIRNRDTDTLKKMLEMEHLNLMEKADEDGMNCLHYAAIYGHPDIADTLIFRRNGKHLAYRGTYRTGQTPAHLAVCNNQLSVLRRLYIIYPEMIEKVDNEGQSILHLAIANNYLNLAKFIIGLPGMEYMINQRDNNGNTPLHVGAMHCCSCIVNILSKNRGVNVDVRNVAGQTPLEIVLSRECKGSGMEKYLTLKALKKAHRTRGINVDCVLTSKNISLGKDRDMAGTLSVISTLIATFMFTAAFTLPGGLKSNGPDEGMATLINKAAFQAFVVTDTTAMATSITASVMLFWSLLHDNEESSWQLLHRAIQLTWVAVVGMPVAFATGLFTVLSNSLWLAIFVCVIGCTPALLFYVFAPLFLFYYEFIDLLDLFTRCVLALRVALVILGKAALVASYDALRYPSFTRLIM